MKIAIVTVGYNRPGSLDRLLHSIAQADYMNDEVDLVISIDKAKNEKDVLKVADRFLWDHGQKHIRSFQERQGLKKHILQCGDLTEYYDAVIVLEDDLQVSESFYCYVKQALEMYQDDSRIAGISLYKHLFHPGVMRPFEAVHNGYDAFFMQFAQSWGQCWTRKMWKEFKEWYHQNSELDLRKGNVLPEYISNWNEHSWLKYYMYYTVQCHKFFVYPMISLSTNLSDVGQHCNLANNDYQVPLLQGKMDFRFPEFEKAIKYDVYFERMDIENEILKEYHSGTKGLDLYGCRSTFEGFRYILSTRNLPYKIVEEISLSQRPIEMNVINPLGGKGIFVYDTEIPCKNKKNNTRNIAKFDIRGLHWRSSFKIAFIEFKYALRRKLGIDK